jgi:hypothetical protein
MLEVANPGGRAADARPRHTFHEGAFTVEATVRIIADRTWSRSDRLPVC